MSSATSTDAMRRPSADTEATSSLFRPWHFFIVAAMVAATVAVLLARDTTPENLVLISLTLVGAGVVGLAVHRALAPLVVEDTTVLGGGLSERARAALEREKALVLRSIKELEFDRAMGKVADVDFNDMTARLRARAIGLMRQLDEQPRGYADLVERDLRARLGTRGAPSAARAPATKGLLGTAAPGRDAAGCAACGTTNDPDAHFCKRCGARLEPSLSGAGFTG